MVFRMTAVAARWLSRCSRYISVEPEAARRAAVWLAQAQQTDGSWPAQATGRNDPHAQALLPLTAQAMLALHQAKVTYQFQVYYVYRIILNVYLGDYHKNPRPWRMKGELRPLIKAFFLQKSRSERTNVAVYLVKDLLFSRAAKFFTKTTSTKP